MGWGRGSLILDPEMRGSQCAMSLEIVQIRMLGVYFQFQTTIPDPYTVIIYPQMLGWAAQNIQ